MTGPVADVRLAARAAMLARENATDATELLYVAVVRAYEAGTPVPDIAKAAGLSRQRVYQIIDANPKPSDPAPTVNEAP